MNTQNNKSKTINLYSFTGLLLALNVLIFPTSLDRTAAIQRVLAPTVQVAETKQAETVIEKPVPKRTIYVMVTAYSSTPDQTDDTPFHTANGTYVRDGIIASNFLKFGTRVRFPDYFGDKIFDVQDRMNERFSDRVDIWMPTREAAIQFGVRTLKMEILPTTLATTK